MSWSGAAYPPPPRRSSPSRSPRTGPPPPRSDPNYSPQDPYRSERDLYEWDRAWVYDRGHDYSRRGRSRSPPPYDGRKRGRSPSPYERDRYEPRPRYGDEYDAHSRGYGYVSPRRGGPPPPQLGYPSSRRPPPDPHNLDHPATLKQFADWFRYYYPQQAIEEDNADKAAEQEAGDGSKPRNGIKTRWEKYKKEFAATQLQTMFDHHRKSPWFAEKYDPAEEMQSLRMRVRKEGWRGRLNAFLLDLEAGKSDPDLTPESTAEPRSPLKESATEGSMGDITSSTPTEAKPDAAGSKPIGADDEMQLPIEADEDAGDHDANATEANGKPLTDSKRTVFASGTRGEEVSVPTEGNQVMIRTLPPDIGRVKLEEACGTIPGFIYLALGDPVQKRNYYRAGWLKFREDADMSFVMSELTEKKIDGFKLHVTHNTRPFINKVRYTAEVASRPDRLEKDLANAQKLASILEEEAATLRKFKITKSPAPPGGATDGADVTEESQGSKDAMVVDGEEATDAEDDPEPPEKGSDALERRIAKIMADLCDQGLVDPNDEKAMSAKRTVIALDLYLAYLRAAFHTCYYCCVVADHLEELQRKCVKHVRKPLSKSPPEEVKAVEAEKAEMGKQEGEEPEKEKEKEKDIFVPRDRSDHKEWKRTDEKWLEWLDSKIALLINRSGVDPRAYGGKYFDEELSKAAESHIKQEDEGKFRCKTCTKLFKATSFVEKHIANKHPELVKHLEEIPYFNNFALDPHRIQPFAYPPQPVGNSQMAPPQAFGLQGPVYRELQGDYGRSGSAYYGGAYPGYPSPYPSNGGYWDPYAYPYGPPVYPPHPPRRRDEATTARPLSDRISGYAPGLEQHSESIIPAAAGLPPKPPAAIEHALPRRGGRGVGGGAPPPPPDAKEDPRAASGKKVSYHDMDLVAEGDVELTY